MSHALDPPPLCHKCHTFSDPLPPLERDVLYGWPHSGLINGRDYSTVDGRSKWKCYWTRASCDCGRLQIGDVTREMEFLSNDYINPNTNPKVLTTLALTLADHHDRVTRCPGLPGTVPDCPGQSRNGKNCPASRPGPFWGNETSRNEVFWSSRDDFADFAVIFFKNQKVKIYLQQNNAYEAKSQLN